MFGFVEMILVVDGQRAFEQQMLLVSPLPDWLRSKVDASCQLTNARVIGLC